VSTTEGCLWSHGSTTRGIHGLHGFFSTSFKSWCR
jgi:hypothetical protein